MKKTFIIIISLIVLLGLGFMYLVKNPELPIAQKVLPVVGMESTQGTEIDLTKCSSYFDGCNNCMVEDGKITACTLMYCETPTEPKCTQYISAEQKPEIDLTNCIRYFDGCNMCSVIDGQPGACTKMYCETPAEPKCLEFGTGTVNSPDQNPAIPVVQ